MDLLFNFLFAWLENIFPPVPSDLLIVFCGSLISLQIISFIPAVIFATLGGTIGFFSMYFLGNKFGMAIVNNQYYKFVTAESLDKIEKWYVHYGFWIIILNRFLSGTRAFISFAAGLMHLHLPSTLSLSSISSLVWNILLLYFGISLGANWKSIGIYLSIYGQIITGIILFVLIVLIVRKLFFSKNK